MIELLRSPSPRPHRKLAVFAVLLLGILGALSFSGCQTPGSAFPQPAADWQTFQGQLQYTSSNGKSIVGDVVIRRSPHDDFQLSFQSGPGFPLLHLWQSRDRSRIEGVLAHGSWQGQTHNPPGHLRSWLRLRDTFAHQTHPQHVKVDLGGDHFVFHFGN